MENNITPVQATNSDQTTSPQRPQKKKHGFLTFLLIVFAVVIAAALVIIITDDGGGDSPLNGKDSTVDISRLIGADSSFVESKLGSPVRTEQIGEEDEEGGIMVKRTYAGGCNLTFLDMGDKNVSIAFTGDMFSDEGFSYKGINIGASKDTLIKQLGKADQEGSSGNQSIMWYGTDEDCVIFTFEKDRIINITFMMKSLVPAVASDTPPAADAQQSAPVAFPYTTDELHDFFEWKLPDAKEIQVNADMTAEPYDGKEIYGHMVLVIDWNGKGEATAGFFMDSDSRVFIYDPNNEENMKQHQSEWRIIHFE